MDQQPWNPFEGMKRLRLPGMHMITAIDGGMPLRDALAAYFFTMLHDKVPHNCLTKKAQEDLKNATNKAKLGASSLEGMTLAGIFGTQANCGLALQEWSYLSDDEVFIFYLLADSAIQQTQRWINEGKEEPFGSVRPFVIRPGWAIARDSEPTTEFVQRSRDYVDKLRREVAAATTT